MILRKSCHQQLRELIIGTGDPRQNGLKSVVSNSPYSTKAGPLNLHFSLKSGDFNDGG